MYTIKQINNRKIIIAKNQRWTDNDCKRLCEEENIIFNKGVIAVEIIPRLHSNPLLRIGIEDDGIISFGADDLTIDASFGKDLIKCTEDAIKTIEKTTEIK